MKWITISEFAMKGKSQLFNYNNMQQQIVAVGTLLPFYYTKRRTSGQYFLQKKIIFFWQKPRNKKSCHFDSIPWFNQVFFAMNWKRFSFCVLKQTQTEILRTLQPTQVEIQEYSARMLTSLNNQGRPDCFLPKSSQTQAFDGLTTITFHSTFRSSIIFFLRE